MALITCPECGREKVSDTATACPECGFPIKQHFETINKQNTEVVYYDVSDGKATISFNNGLNDGVKGRCTDRYGTYDYYVDVNQLHIMRNKHDVCYVIVEYYLLNLNGKYDGYVPEGETIEAFCECKYVGSSIQLNLNGTYSTHSNISVENGRYERKNEFLIIAGGNTGNKPRGRLIYQNVLYGSAYVSAEKATDLQPLLQKSQNSYVNSPTTNVVKCPYCQSTAVKK